jgi:regulator of replication initiation timing
VVGDKAIIETRLGPAQRLNQPVLHFWTKQLIKQMAALEKELEELREQLTSKEELIAILIKEKDALKMRLEYEKKEAGKA